MLGYVRGARALILGSTIWFGASARAEGPLACPPCGPNARCEGGVCLPNGEPPPVQAPPVQAPPADAAPPPPPAEPAPVEAAPPAPVEATPPAAEAPPAPRATTTTRRRTRVAPKREEPQEEQEIEQRAPVRAPLASWRKGMLIMPYAGFHAIEGIAANDYDAGLRIGGLVGAHVVPSVSLNLELAMNFLSPKNDGGAPRATPSGHDLTIAFSPLFHASAGPGEFVIGPKIGFWSSSISVGGTGDQFSQTGWAFGFNVGAFAGLTDDIALGGLLAYQMTFLSQSCSRGPDVVTTGCDSGGFPPQILSFAVAALF